MSAKRKKEAPAPARIAPHDSAELPAGLEWTMPEEAPAQPAPASEELWTDPWAAAKCAGLHVERVVQKCPGRTERDERGVWKVTPAVLEACGTSPTASRQVVAMARSLASLGPDAEGAVVYALSGPGRVAVMSAAKAPRSARVLAQVREPSRLRCGDEVAIRYTESGRAEVVHGR